MALLNFEIEGQKVLSRNFRILADEVKTMKPEFRNIGAAIIEESQKHFNNGWIEGSKWKKLSPATVKARKNRFWHYKKKPAGAGARGPILVWTWKLKKGFEKQTGNLHVVVSNKVPYFKYHQTKNRKSNKLPRRVILFLNQGLKLRISNIIAKGINKRVWNFKKQY